MSIILFLITMQMNRQILDSKVEFFPRLNASQLVLLANLEQMRISQVDGRRQDYIIMRERFNLLQCATTQTLDYQALTTLCIHRNVAIFYRLTETCSQENHLKNLQIYFCDVLGMMDIILCWILIQMSICAQKIQQECSGPLVLQTIS